MKRILLICLQLIVFNASSAQSDEITPLELFDGANKYETEAIVFGLKDEILNDVKYYLTESHFISGPICSGGEANCRQNFKFGLDFEVASIDLNLNGSDEVVVIVHGADVCGSGGCWAYILESKDYTWNVIAHFFPANYLGISSEMTNGYFDISYKGKSNDYSCEFNGAVYKCD
jgi:hypothetical protein